MPAFSAIVASLLISTSSISFADHNSAESLAERVAPVGSLNVLTPEQAAEQAAQAAPVEVASTAEPDGEAVYNVACLACHGAGVAGAPKVGDAGAWEPRLAQGMEVLIEHAINGFQGDAGVMPARGGNASLSDEEVAAAVEFMVN